MNEFIFPRGDNFLHEVKTYFLGKIRHINFSSAELAQRLVKVNLPVKQVPYRLGSMPDASETI